MTNDWRDDPRFKLSEKEKKESRKQESSQNAILNALGALFILFLIYTFLIKPTFEGVSGFFDDKAQKKANCQTSYSVRNAKTEFAAKQAFDKCMNR